MVASFFDYDYLVAWVSPLVKDFCHLPNGWTTAKQQIESVMFAFRGWKDVIGWVVECPPLRARKPMMT
jgi:hypothetical protein